jgi:Uma2 family endonuclease
MSLGEWAGLDPDIEGELVDGVLEPEEMPSVVHETIVAHILASLRAWLVPRGGFAVGSELKLAVSPRRGRKADVVAYLPGAARPSGRDKLIRVPPSLVVEVITDTPRDARRDRIEKAAEYSAFGVRFYWLVDPEARTLEIFERTRSKKWSRVVAVAEGTFLVPGCSGLTFDVDQLWREVDAIL